MPALVNKKFLLGLILVLGLSSPGKILANQTKISWQIAPIRQEVILTTGQSLERHLRLSNLSDQGTLFKLAVSNWSTTPDHYDLRQVLSLATTSIYLAGQESKLIPLKFNAKANSFPGAYHGQILVSAENQTTAGQQAQISTELSSQVVVSVGSGAWIKGQGQITFFDLMNKHKFVWKKLPHLQVVINNQGLIYLKPGLKLKLRQGNKEGDGPVLSWLIMPGESRSKLFAWPDQPASSNRWWPIQTYQLSATLYPGYGTTGQTKQFTLWLINEWSVGWLILISIILLLILGRWSRRLSIKILLLLLICFINPLDLKAYDQPRSSNYYVEADSINFLGGGGTSANFQLAESTGGETATGRNQSTNFWLGAGYLEMVIEDDYLSVTAPSSITLSPALGNKTGGVATGQDSLTVSTNNSSGYQIKIKASTNPALKSTSDNLPDYPHVNPPSFLWSTATNQAYFGYQISGDHPASRFLNNGSSCQVGSFQTADRCWSGLTTSDQLIASHTSAVSNDLTTIKLKAEAGPTAQLSAGTYQAELIFTVEAL